MAGDGAEGRDGRLHDRLSQLLLGRPYAAGQAGALARRLRDVAAGLEAQTAEGHLFAALRKTRLIDPAATWQSLGYSRCGRTDKGVSALGQVVALRLRSLGRTGGEVPPPEAEMDYARALNRALPSNIRVLGWCPVPRSFSARFSALRREYKYLFVQDGSLDLGAMAASGAHLLGTHDFRNFCKVDAAHVASFERTVLDFRIEPVAAVGCGGHSGAGALYAMHIVGTAFLWHQVRCIAAVLLLVGRGLEAPGIVAALLDVATVPAKPQYTLAPEVALQERIERDTLNLGLLGIMAAVLDSQAAEAEGISTLEARKHVPLLARGREPPLTARLRKARPIESSQRTGVGVDKGLPSQGDGANIDLALTAGVLQKSLEHA